MARDQAIAQTITLAEAEHLAGQALERAGTAAAAAASVARAITRAEADGLSSHGLARIPAYCAQVRTGKVDGRAEPKLVPLGASGARVDARCGFACSDRPDRQGREHDRRRDDRTGRDPHARCMWSDLSADGRGGVRGQRDRHRPCCLRAQVGPTACRRAPRLHRPIPGDPLNLRDLAHGDPSRWRQHFGSRRGPPAAVSCKYSYHQLDCSAARNQPCHARPAPGAGRPQRAPPTQAAPRARRPATRHPAVHERRKNASDMAHPPREGTCPVFRMPPDISPAACGHGPNRIRGFRPAYRPSKIPNEPESRRDPGKSAISLRERFSRRARRSCEAGSR
jgi:Malate/L-lactate dehydrogenase